MAKVHITLGDDQSLTPEEQEQIFGDGPITKLPTSNGTTLFGSEQESISDEQLAAMSNLTLPGQIMGRGILHHSPEEE